MKRNYIKLLIIICTILLPLMSCGTNEDKVINGTNKNKPTGLGQNDLSNEKNDNQEYHSIKVVLKRLSQDEYDSWVKKSYDGFSRPDSEQLTLPDIDNFDYPYVEGIVNSELKNKINQVIKNAIFNEDFFSEPMSGVEISSTPYSEFESPGIIIRNDILSIPITLYWDVEHNNYKSMSVTIDLKTGERLYLDDIIKLNEEFASRLLYETGFFINIEVADIKVIEYLYSYSNADVLSKNEASKKLLEMLRHNTSEDEKPEVEEYYLTKEGIVLTEFANAGVPIEYNIPLKNLKGFLKIKSWE